MNTDGCGVAHPEHMQRMSCFSKVNGTRFRHVQDVRHKTPFICVYLCSSVVAVIYSNFSLTDARLL